MKIKYLALSFAIGAAACTLQAQQSMPDMPGMQMGPQQPKPQPKPQAPRSDMPDMPGMDMGAHSASKASKPIQAKQPADPMPENLSGMKNNAGNARAKAAAASVEQSFQQQAGQAEKKPGPESDASSIKVPIQDLQEPEAVGFRTGSDLPAPELLREVVDRDPMTVENFLQLADKGNPTLSQAQRNVERSNQQGRQMGLPPNPVIGYTGDHIRGGEYHGGEQGAFFSQEIILGRKLALRHDIFRMEAHSNEQAVEIQRARVHNDVGRAFYDTLAAQQSVVIHDRLLKVALDAETNAHELERIGIADASAVLTAEVAAEQAKVEFVNSQRMFLASFTRLATDAGQSGLIPHPLAGSLVEPPELDAEAMVEKGTQESPLVKQAAANVSVAEARVKSARRESVPNLSIKAGEWNGGEELSKTTKRVGFESFAEVGILIPIWNRNQGNTEASKVQLERAREDLTRTQLVTRNRLSPYAQQYQTARFTAERYRTEILPRALRAYQLEVVKYQQMAQPYPPVLIAQQMLFSLQLSYIKALNEEWEAAIALQNYALMGGLEEPLSVGTDETTRNLPNAGGGGD